MTRKRITVPCEPTTPSVTEAVDAFLNEISNFRAPKLHFFDESSVIKTTGNRKYGSAVLGEPAIDCGITLLFQPPYSPDFNTCEFCFRQIKDYLRRYQLFAEHETKIAIAEAILQISQENSFLYFHHCGYIF